LNRRDRFLATFSFKEVDRLPDYEFGYWDETIDRWHEQGLPSHLKSQRDVELFFGLEGWESEETLPVVTGIWPRMPERILSESADTVVVDDGMGGIYVKKRWTSSVPHYLRHPIRDRADWERLRPFFDPDTPGRYPVNWDEIAERYRDRDYPVRISVGSLYGWLRNWMGVERLSLAFYREPDWVEEMMDTLTNLWMRVLPRALRDVEVDYATWWEDMCYSRGPLLSVRLFEEFMVPRYKMVTDLLKDKGVMINVLDCDGRIDELVPGWLKGGINCMFPLEAAHTDALGLRRRFGKQVLLMGGVNKLALARSRDDIDAEINRLAPLVEEGGFIPTVDHRVPPDVPLVNYSHYLKKKREAIGRIESTPDTQ
jgi:uroporphyrinogen decarboxylase